MDKKNTSWINIVKAIAILDMIIAHTQDTLYTDNRIMCVSYATIQLFIFTMGITTYWSFAKGNVLEKTKRRILGIFTPYMLATAVYLIYRDSMFDSTAYINALLHFNVVLPMYYVQMYIQLLLICPVIYLLVSMVREKKVFEQIVCNIVIFVVLVAASAVSIRYMNFFDIYGGAGFLLTGTFLIVIYIGMLIGAYYEYIDNMSMPVQIIGLIISGALMIFTYRHICNDGFSWSFIARWGVGENPPGIDVISYSFFAMSFIYFVTKLLTNSTAKVIELIASGFNYLGQHTLYIFIYHILMLNILRDYNVVIENRVVKAVVYFGVMILGSWIIEYIVTFIKKVYRNIDSRKAE